MGIKERPFRINSDKDFNSKDVESLLAHFDENFRDIDQRRISQTGLLADDASNADIVEAFNNLVTLMNNSDLTEES